ncbi:MAG: hypothetical protein AAFO04_20190 [Cyanobacteria bacterium J06592_8]
MNLDERINDERSVDGAGEKNQWHQLILRIFKEVLLYTIQALMKF